MTISPPNPKSFSDWKAYSQQLYYFLTSLMAQKATEPQSVLLAHKTGNEKAATEGVMLYDPNSKVPVISVNSQWAPILVGNQIQIGTASLTSATAGTTVNFSQSFANAPAVLAIPSSIPASGNTARIANVGSVAPNAFIARLSDISAGAVNTVAGDIAWIAIGTAP